MVMRAALLSAAVTSVQADHYAVLVAGSNTLRNYRHQADVCHAYQVVKANGVPEANIIVMAYDDVANNSLNPFPGKLFNKPSAAGVEGVDVYAGCKIDYKGDDVNPTNFVNVLTGKGSGKVLKSTSKDNVFIYFADHGAPGLICFPADGGTTAAGQLHKAEFQSAIGTMHSQNMYKKLVMYLETCESGSMFEGMTTPNVYALSAANPSESSWAAYCGDDATVNGKKLGWCLGDVFSVNWMEDSDAVDITTETLDAQFQTVKTKTTKSEVMQWGELGFITDKVSDYQGNTHEVSAVKTPAGKQGISYNARQVDLQQAYDHYTTAATSQERLAAGEEFEAILKDQLEVEAAYERFLENVYGGNDAKKDEVRTASYPADNMECELSTRAAFLEHGQFDSWTGFSLGFHKYVVNTCHDIIQRGKNIDLATAAKKACEGATVV